MIQERQAQVTYHFTSNKYDKRLSVLHTYHSNLICFSEGTTVADEITDSRRFWHQNEPNFSAEQCATIVFWESRGWGWNDVFCDSKRNSICEMKKIYL
ncbi:C-type lectin domain family 6 member A-like [Ictidomys tridecemlineatus]|nr:C-type lectin domain family 6 member A-like [Ictidomys tridecemlineatus]